MTVGADLHFVLLASSGILAVMTPEQAATLVHIFLHLHHCTHTAR
jgi:flagellar motility protein MotE (MotC chaperone)